MAHVLDVHDSSAPVGIQRRGGTKQALATGFYKSEADGSREESTSVSEGWALDPNWLKEALTEEQLLETRANIDRLKQEIHLNS